MSKNTPYNTCPYCGDHLDYGERCECIENREGAQPAGEYADQPTTANPQQPVLMPGA
jgi:hypothetical protein